jgi:hypothetical protein
MSLGHLNYGSWFFRVISWDAILPFCLLIVPMLIELCFPNQRGVMEVVAVTLPIAAFLLRIRAGWRHITTNRCSDFVRRFQFFVFCLGILPLVLIDCFMILSHLMPQGAQFATRDDVIVLAIVFAIYLTLMTVAMYPGRALSSPADWDVLIESDELHPRRIQQENVFPEF